MADTADVVTAFLASQEKWTTLLADVDRYDDDVLTEIVANEIYSKIDENAYGL